VLLIGCVEPYETNSFKYEKVVVVDGLLTNGDGPHTINLSYTKPMNSDAPNPIQGAEVWIVDDKGNRETFTESKSGVYVSSANYRGIAGRSYQLHFITPDGQQFRSSTETLMASPEIDSIYTRFATLPDETQTENVTGIQIFLDTHDDTKNVSTFRYEWNDTFQVIPEYPSKFEHKFVITEHDASYWEHEDENGNVSIETSPAFVDTVLEISPRTKKVWPCYKSRHSSKLIIGNIANALGKLSEQPILFISSLEPTLKNRYSIEVTQYAITPKTFNYYRKIKESAESVGSLFDKQTGTIAGNITNIDHPNEAVLGNFEVSGTTKKRIFLKSEQLDPQFATSANYAKCYTTDIYSTNALPTSQYPLPKYPMKVYLQPYLGYEDVSYFHIIDKIPSLFGSFYIIIGPYSCTTCHWYATTEPPDFWPDKELF
jgi:hypothetical protein